MSDIEAYSTRLRGAAKPSPVKIGKSDRTRATVLDAALDFVWSQPFHAMTVGSLMATTGVSRSAFYQYFRDLHAVMEALLDMLAAEILGGPKNPGSRV